MPPPPLAALVAQTALPDTVVMYVARDGLETVALLSTIVVGVFFLLLVPLLFLVLLEFRSLRRTVKRLGERGLAKADPLLERAREVGDNLAFVSRAVRTDVEHLTDSVRSMSERLRDASDHLEERVLEFNALMEVVQSEAEEIFIGSASTIRGVRAGSRSLLDGGRDDAGPAADVPGTFPGTGTPFPADPRGGAPREELRTAPPTGASED